MRSSAVSNFDVADAPTLDELMPQLRAFAGDDPIVAHDPDILQAFLAGISDQLQWLSLLDLAPRSWQFNMARDFRRSGLVKHGDMEDRPMIVVLPPHRAEGEAVMSGIVMCEMLEEFERDGYSDLGEIYRLARVRRPQPWFAFGHAYRGPIADIPEYALRWILLDASKPPRQRCHHLDKDTLYAIQVHLNSYVAPPSKLAQNVTARLRCVA